MVPQPLRHSAKDNLESIGRGDLAYVLEVGTGGKGHEPEMTPRTVELGDVVNGEIP